MCTGRKAVSNWGHIRVICPYWSMLSNILTRVKCPSHRKKPSKFLPLCQQPMSARKRKAKRLLWSLYLKKPDHDEIHISKTDISHGWYLMGIADNFSRSGSSRQQIQ